MKVMNIEQEFKKFLHEWVKKMYGQSEADDPSWSIEALAYDLASKYWEVRDRHELENVKDDVLMVAKENGIKITDKQAYAVADKYRFSEAYCAPDRESIKYFIEHYKGEE